MMANCQSRPSLRQGALFILVLLLCALVAPVAAQDPKAPGDAVPVPAERRKALLEGTQVFRRILHDYECKPLDDFAELKDDPKRTILIILGDLEKLNSVPNGVEDFVRRGGAVLLASDRAVRDPAALRALIAVSGVSINNEQVACFSRQDCYKQLHYCPCLKPIFFGRPPFLPLVEDGEQLLVATNMPSHLRFRLNRLPGTVQLLAVLPRQCVYEVGPQEFRPLANPEEMLPFLAGGDLGEGRVLVAADHSVFINEMMLPADTKNVEFTYNCLRWLRGDTPRDRVLFVDEQGIQTKFDFPLKSAQIPIDEILELLFRRRNHLIQTAQRQLYRVQQNDGFTRLSGRIADHIDYPYGRLFAFAALMASLSLALYGVYRLGIRSRFGHDTSTPLLTHALNRNLPHGPVADQRVDALLRTGRMNEPAALLATRWLAASGVAVTDPAPVEPPIQYKSGWRAWKLRRRLGRVWRLALGIATEKVKPSDLWRLQRELESLTKARQRGEWYVR